MCLSTVYNEKHEMLAKNVATVKAEKGRLIFTDIMGIPTVVDGRIDKVDLMENEIFIAQSEKQPA
ncbi:MAG: CooT family nickel-binding protein [Oscillospiraceae bacterium]|nr:CooT family nickel-binding protein [Oscillospiraceae bacterium]